MADVKSRDSKADFARSSKIQGGSCADICIEMKVMDMTSKILRLNLKSRSSREMLRNYTRSMMGMEGNGEPVRKNDTGSRTIDKIN